MACVPGKKAFKLTDVMDGRMSEREGGTAEGERSFYLLASSQPRN